jgi:hypothetical protein
MVAILFIAACSTDKNKYPPEPFLQINGAYVYNNGNGKDSFIELDMFYRDGDGDIGLDVRDTIPPFQMGSPDFYNLLIWMYEKKNGKWVKPFNALANPPDTVNFHERIPRITPTGRVKWIEGKLTVYIPAEPFGLKPDTVKLKARLTDRALRRSAWVESDILILKH